MRATFHLNVPIPQSLPLRLHPHRTARRDRHYRDSRQHAVAGINKAPIPNEIFNGPIYRKYRAIATVIGREGLSV
jgi:hypothetical protein